jgi:Eukaryotic aspartyl protease
VTIGDLAVTDQIFEEADDVSIDWWILSWWMGYDGALGLAPPWLGDQGDGIPSFFDTLLSREILDEPLFSLKLPVNTRDSGELLLGGTNPELYHEDTMVRLPVIEGSSDFWCVPADSITFNHPHRPLHVDMPTGSFAMLDSGWPYIMLPPELFANITAAVGASEGPSIFFYNIPCERRQELPSITFTLAGHNFTIDAFDYTLEVDILWAPQVGRVCVLSFQDSSQWFDGGEWQDRIYLSHPFLRGFYGVFDAGRREVGCECAKAV